MRGIPSSVLGRICAAVLSFVLCAGPVLQAGPAFASEPPVATAEQQQPSAAVETSPTELPAAAAEQSSSATVESSPTVAESTPSGVQVVAPATPSEPLADTEATRTLVRELVEKRTEDSTHWLYSDGSVRAEISQAPVRFEDEDGQWRDISTDLVVGESFGAVESASTEMTTTFDVQSGDEAPVSLATDEYSVGIDYLGAAERARVVYGDTTRYLNVAADTDLEYRALAEGIKETLVLKSANAPATH